MDTPKSPYRRLHVRRREPRLRRHGCHATTIPLFFCTALPVCTARTRHRKVIGGALQKNKFPGSRRRDPHLTSDSKDICQLLIKRNNKSSRDLRPSLRYL